MEQNRIAASTGNGTPASSRKTPVVDPAAQHSPRDLLRVIFRHKRKVAGFFFVTMAITILAVLYWPRRYVSPAKLFVQLGRESVGIDPTATTGETIQVRDSRESELNSIIQILQSRALAIAVVEALGPDTVLGRKQTTGTAGEAPSAGTWDPRNLITRIRSLRKRASLDPVSKREKAISTVQSSLKINAVEESKVIGVTYAAASPQLAQQVASTVLEEYLKLHALVHRVPGSQKFFEKQTQRQRTELVRAREELRDFKNEAGIVSIQGKRSGLQERENWLDLRLLQTTVEKEAARLETSALQVASLDSQIETMLQQRNGLAEELGELNEAEIRIADLERRVTGHERDYRDYAKRLEQVRMDAALAEDSISNVNIVQPPALVEKPVQPQKKILFVAGLFLAISGALVLAFSAEFLDQSLKTPAELESTLQLPVLVSIPRTSSHALT